MDTTTTPTITLDHPGLNDAERQAALALMRALDAYRAERGCPPSAVVTLHAKDVAVSQTIAERLESMLFERMAIPLAHVPAALFDAVGRARDRHRKALTAFTVYLQPPPVDPAGPDAFTGDPAPAPGNANLRIGENHPPANAGPRPWQHTATNEHAPEALAKEDGEPRETAQPVTTGASHRQNRPAATPLPSPGNANLRIGETRGTAQPVTTSASHRQDRPAATPPPSPGNANLRIGETRGAAQPVTTSASHRQDRPAATPLPRSLGKAGWPTQRDSANRDGSAPPGAPPAAPVDPPSHRFPMNVPVGTPTAPENPIRVNSR